VTKYLLMGTSSNFGGMFSMAAASVFLTFLPMLPTQVLLNNLLYDLAQITIPTDNVDPEVLRRPQRWDIASIRRFMFLIGPISSLYDFLTFFVLLHFFHAGEKLFHSGWFVESLATQTLVLLVIRTARSPLKSRPSLPLAITTLGRAGRRHAAVFTARRHARLRAAAAELSAVSRARHADVSRVGGGREAYAVAALSARRHTTHRFSRRVASRALRVIRWAWPWPRRLARADRRRPVRWAALPLAAAVRSTARA
jgi:hypothetical protein